jgi:hypothetical protein
MGDTADQATTGNRNLVARSGDEPPDEQYIYLHGVWKPLKNGYHLMDMIIDGQPDLDGPFPNAPEGVPPAPPLARF